MSGKRAMLGIITARMASSRLPGKTMLPLGGKPVLEHLIDRIKASRALEDIVIATSTDPANAPILEMAERCRIGCYSGAEEDVLDRYVRILRDRGADHCVRFCADNPLTDMETTARLVALHVEHGADYTCVKGLRLPLGLTEVISRHALEVSHEEAPEGFRRESITVFIREHSGRFRVKTLAPDPFLHQTAFRLTLDYPEDYELLRVIFERLYDGAPIEFRRVLEFLRDNPAIAAINQGQAQKPGNRYWEELDAKLP